jgi:hypothetical protein
MKNGDYIHKGGGSPIYGPTFGRSGLAALFSGTILQLIGTPNIKIEVETKNRDDTAFVSIGNVTVSSLGVFSFDVDDIQEEVRFVYTITATDPWEGVLLLMTSPAWRPYA